MTRWRCQVCGYVHQGDRPPWQCPNCSAPEDRFQPVEADFDEIHLPYGQKLAYASTVVVNQFFGDLATLAPYLYNLPKGLGVLPHRHPGSDEMLFVLKGRVRFRVDKRELMAVPGDLVKVSAGTAHAFENAGEEPAALLSAKAPKPVRTEFIQPKVPAQAEPEQGLSADSEAGPVHSPQNETKLQYGR
ncbi:MAG: cupin domain-containing protein [candidate division WOR-3 bacterium]